MSQRYVTECDECGREDVVGCIGGTHYYCTRHEEAVTEMHYQDWLTRHGPEGVLR